MEKEQRKADLPGRRITDQHTNQIIDIGEALKEEASLLRIQSDKRIEQLEKTSDSYRTLTTQIKVLIVSVLVVLGVAIVLLFTLIDLANSNRGLLKKLNNCLDPKGQCAKEQAKNQEPVIDQIVNPNKDEKNTPDLIEIQTELGRIKCLLAGSPPGECLPDTTDQ